MDWNWDRALASEVFLIHHWQQYVGTTEEKRCKIFQEFVRLGARGRWPWHTLAEKFTSWSKDELSILRSCRNDSIRWIAQRLGEDLEMALVTKEPASYPRAWVAIDGDPMMVCEYSGDPFDILPELCYSMTAYDDPEDVEEARQGSQDQSLWVTGVFWSNDKILWVIEYGQTIREMIPTDGEELVAMAFSRLRPFDTTWWTDAHQVGIYAVDGGSAS